jgi:hypothetical protein
VQIPFCNHLRANKNLFGRWISCTDARINAYAHILEDTYEISLFNRRISLKSITTSFISDYSISSESAQLLSKYGYIPSTMTPANEVLFTSSLAKIPAYDGSIFRHCYLNDETITALETSFLNDKQIQLSTIVNGGYNKYIFGRIFSR